ncbi:universal stress protein [Methylovirgula sp. 4M-Z18]|uniref:universal stress protein n=2 Tax=Methylovirgula sp. 4M-Z18 TaxID=2293567 RepID=UPI0030CE0F82
MTYTSLMAHVDPEAEKSAILDISVDLAKLFDAKVIGVAACQPLQLVYAHGYVPPEIIDQNQIDMEKMLKQAGAQFYAAMQGRAPRYEWRASVTVDALANYFAGQSGTADLFITQRASHQNAFDRPQHLNLGDFVMRSGRPVLIIPPDASRVALDHVVVAWKETREARRAIADAIPLLGKARRVTIATIVPEEEENSAQMGLEDIVGWLKGHHVKADSRVLTAAGRDTDMLADFLLEQQADLVVAGAYGHNRLREWVFGGMTADLLLSSGYSVLLSH